MSKSAFALAAAIALVISTDSAALAAPPAEPRPWAPIEVTGANRQVLRHDDKVIVTAEKPGGITAIAIYDMPDAASGAELYRRLGGTGDIGLMARAPYVECATSYGGAQFISNTSACVTPYRWTYGPFSRPQVYFRDHTPSQWPVRAAVTQWNQSFSIDVYWTTSCPSASTGRHCVHVWNANYGPGWEGEVYMEVNSSNYFVDGAVVVHLNDYYSSAEDNASTTCHELGHAIGLAHHRNEQTSCMFNSGLVGPDPSRAHANDIHVLNNVIY